MKAYEKRAVVDKTEETQVCAQIDFVPTFQYNNYSRGIMR